MATPTSDLTHLYTDHNDQGGCRGDSKCLVISERLSGVLGGIRQHSIWNKKQHHRCVDALGDADEELSLVEEQVELTGFVKLWILQTPLIRNILQQKWRMKPE